VHRSTPLGKGRLACRSCPMWPTNQGNLRLSSVIFSLVFGIPCPEPQTGSFRARLQNWEPGRTKEIVQSFDNSQNMLVEKKRRREEPDSSTRLLGSESRQRPQFLSAVYAKPVPSQPRQTDRCSAFIGFRRGADGEAVIRDQHKPPGSIWFRL